MTETSTPADRSTSTFASTCRWLLVALPFIAILLVYLWASANTARSRLMREWTQSPWESEIVMDAWRVVHHLPVYTDPATGHATHMYGPLGTYIVAPFIKKYGADPRIPRFIAITAALALSLLAAIFLSRRTGAWWMTSLFIFGLCYLQFYRIREWATESRPDATALFCGFVSLIFMARALSAGSKRAGWIWAILATTATLVTFFFKQPVTMIALVGPLVLIIDRPPDIWRKLLFTLIPIIAVAIAILSLKLFWPMTFHYMVVVPAKYPVSWGTWLLAVLEVLRFNTLFIACLFIWAAMRFRENCDVDPIDRWLLAAVVVTGMIGAAARAKFGGYFNSLLPAYLAMSIFAARRLPGFFRLLSGQNLLGAILLASIPAILLIVDNVSPAGGRTLNPGAIALQQGDRNFTTIIRLAKTLPGKFVSPDDPLIALNAKAYAGRCGECELDAAGRDRIDFPTPEYLLAEIRDADWVLQVEAARPSSIPASDLQRLGFEKSVGIIPQNSVYSLWRRGNSITIQ